MGRDELPFDDYELRTPAGAALKRFSQQQPKPKMKKKQTKKKRESTKPPRNSAASGNLSKKTTKAIKKMLREGDISDALEELFKHERTKFSASLLEQLLQDAAKSGDGVDYADVLYLLARNKVTLSLQPFLNALESLTARMPAPVGMLRLTLNLAVPQNGETTPLVPDLRLSGRNDERELDQSLYAGCVHDVRQRGAGDYADVRNALGAVHVEELCGLVDAGNEAQAAYFSHFNSVLHLDFIEELLTVQRRLEQLPREVLERRGVMYDGLIPSPSDLKGCMRLRLQRPRSSSTETKFVPGESWLLSRNDPLTERSVQLVSLKYVSEVFMDGSRDILVSLPTKEKLGREYFQGHYRLDKTANYQDYSRQVAVLKKIAMLGRKSEQKISSLWHLPTMGSVGGKNIDSWVAKLMHKEEQEPVNAQTSSNLIAWADDCPSMSMTRGDEIRSYIMQSNRKTSLNRSQSEAVAAAAVRRFTIIQGPPGTGKTHVSVELLDVWTSMNIRPVLVTSHNNVAVDNIAESALRKGLNVIRVGRTDRVSPEMEQCCLDQLVPRSDDATYDFEERVRLLKRADVVCVTTMSSATAMLSALNFAAILMDEAAQATELSAMVPIMSCKAERLVLVGDQCQLPANVLSFEAENRGFTLSLFSRCLNQGVKPFFLDTQFRMHPAIAAHSSAAFYNNRLLDGVVPEDRRPPAGFPWPRRDAGVALLHRQAEETREGASWSNPAEVRTVISILQEVLNAGDLEPSEIGVVTPYVGQVRVMRRGIREALPRDLLPNIQDLEVKSVDGFQGREKELIIFSAVRSNRWGNVGFLADWRRLNVMITRARRGLIVIGDVSTLRKDRSWSSWIAWARSEGFEMSS
eukprot:TRINITY_DN28676_c0_g1_i1.p1 TRINITY_DN28676_c0_g1~~TRINITY_DN28676_c0_g1_i1.p1  ORF type:complete len:971 (-),score=178.11 TRINITY_DN28676_c0_g1_i1:322-2904(-)